MWELKLYFYPSAGGCLYTTDVNLCTSNQKTTKSLGHRAGGTLVDYFAPYPLSLAPTGGHKLCLVAVLGETSRSKMSLDGTFAP